MVRVILTAIGFLLAPIVLISCFLAVKQQFFREPCRPYVDTELAIATIESELRKASNSGILDGAKPVIEEIEEIQNFAQWPDQKAYSFRLMGAASGNGPHAVIDPCGGVDISGSLSGK
jgi:hypothetical protein